MPGRGISLDRNEDYAYEVVMSRHEYADKRVIVSLRVIFNDEVEEVDESGFAQSVLEGLQHNGWDVDYVQLVDQSYKEPRSNSGTIARS